MYRKYLKRAFDFFFAIMILLVSSPLFLTATLLLYFQNNGNIFYCQKRPGLNHKPFLIIKFKTMNDLRNQKGELLTDIERLTPVGSWLRKLSLDELPQLINVLKGEMSLVGPRPLLFEYIPLYSSIQDRRHEVRPGITGWAQVSGRNTITWIEKFELDVFYVDHITFLFDLRIIWMTIAKIFTREGINQSEDITMEPFTGNN